MIHPFLSTPNRCDIRMFYINLIKGEKKNPKCYTTLLLSTPFEALTNKHFKKMYWKGMEVGTVCKITGKK